MPLLTYRCPECGATVEALLPLGADPPACAECRATMQRSYQGVCTFGTSGKCACGGECATCPGCTCHQ